MRKVSFFCLDDQSNSMITINDFKNIKQHVRLLPFNKYQNYDMLLVHYYTDYVSNELNGTYKTVLLKNSKEDLKDKINKFSNLYLNRKVWIQ